MLYEMVQSRKLQTGPADAAFAESEAERCVSVCVCEDGLGDKGPLGDRRVKGRPAIQYDHDRNPAGESTNLSV